jgi:trehalose 6-phosphate synthase/phosphatase
MPVLHSPDPGIGPTALAAGGRTLIVSNRLPLTAHIQDGELRLRQSDGGLANGLRAVHGLNGGLWIGWSGLTDELSPDQNRIAASRLREYGACPVPLSREEVAGYYRGYCNGSLWPLLHDCLRDPEVVGSDWELYQRVNQRYAEVIAESLRAGDRVWIHDFHLMLVPRLLRECCPDARIGFFLHTPFPSARLFATLPQASALLEGILGADRIGFHTRTAERHFSAAVRLLLGRRLPSEADPGEPSVFSSPMGIDAPFFAAWARKPTVIAEARRVRGKSGARLFVAVDRLDYTKGIAERLRAFERLLEQEPELRGCARLIQIAVPSREDSGGYAEIRQEVETLVAGINRRFGGKSTPVEYRYTRVDTATLVALYCAADVMLVTPLCDGMNLVAKEFVASREDEDGVLVLSSRAGAAAELYAAVLTNPADPHDLLRAYRVALQMPAVERRFRMRHLRHTVLSHDVFEWSKCCLELLEKPNCANPRYRGRSWQLRGSQSGAG